MGFSIGLILSIVLTYVITNWLVNYFGIPPQTGMFITYGLTAYTAYTIFFYG